MSSLPRFPEGFLWGASTAAYQIEGAVAQDGRGPSIWDTFSHTEGRTKDGDTGDVAADHYHRWPEDVGLLAELGVNTYRFSIALPRIQPSGSGAANPRCLDFYDQLLHGLAAGPLHDRGLGVMIANNCTPVRPASEAEHDIAAAAAYDALHNRLFNDPVLLGTYPDLSALGPEAYPSFIEDDDLKIIGAPLEGLGINYYTPSVVGYADPADNGGLPFTLNQIEGVPTTAFGWPVVPDGLRELLVGLRGRYGSALPPIYITENGCSTNDVLTNDRRVTDAEP